jgi:hypothetical protein
MRRIDLKLQELYSYIKRNYKKEEVVVTMFSDHGVSFNVDTGDPIMSEQRVNVPLMIYCDWEGEHLCREKVETIDYGHIICKLSGIEDERLAVNDGMLPKFFGGETEKEWIFSQSLFPDRPYAASIIAKDWRYYLESREMVKNDCTIDLKGSGYSLVNNQKEPLDDPELAEQCLQLVLEMLGDYLL